MQFLLAAIVVVIASLGNCAAEPFKKERVAVFVVGGKPAASTKFSATGSLSGAGELCTGTAIGPQTVLTAAHCVEHEKSASIQFGKKLVDLTCSRHGDYPAKGACSDSKDTGCAADVALCK